MPSRLPYLVHPSSAAPAPNGDTIASYPGLRLMLIEPSEATAAAAAGVRCDAVADEPLTTVAGSVPWTTAARAAPSPSGAHVDRELWIVQCYGPVHPQLASLFDAPITIRAHLSRRACVVLGPPDLHLRTFGPSEAPPADVEQIDIESSGFVIGGQMRPDPRASATISPAFIQDFFRFPPILKIAKSLRGDDLLSPGTTQLPGDPDERLPVSVAVTPGAPSSTLELLLGPEVAERAQGTGSAIGRVARGHLLALAADRAVEAILPFVAPRLLNDRGRKAIGLSIPVAGAGHALDGAGEVIAVFDTGLDNGAEGGTLVEPRSEDLAGCAITVVATAPEGAWVPKRGALPELEFERNVRGADAGDNPEQGWGHGTHVIGTLVASGATARAATADDRKDATGVERIPAGVVRRASVVVYSMQHTFRVPDEPGAESWSDGVTKWPVSGLYGVPDSLLSLFGRAAAEGARLSNNSWGGAGNGGVTTWTKDVETFCVSNPDHVVVFGAGNARPGGPLDTFAPNHAWNAIAVGALEPGGSVASYSCFDAGDERMKPDLVAPGTAILSLRSRGLVIAEGTTWSGVADQPNLDAYLFKTGTSMATPFVTGLAAIVRQYLRTVRGLDEDGVRPTAALVKAMLINGAVDVPLGIGQAPAPTPNRRAGWGRIDGPLTFTSAEGVPAALIDAEEPGITPLETLGFDAVVGPDAPTVRVTLAWTDAGGSFAGGTLQADLQLVLVSPSGVRHTAEPPAPTPVRRVEVANAEAGSWRVLVHARQAPADGQPFALVMRNLVGPAYAPRTLGLVVDTTAAMGTMDAGEDARLAIARRRLIELADALRPGDRLFVASSDAPALTERNGEVLRTAWDWLAVGAALVGEAPDATKAATLSLRSQAARINAKAPAGPRHLVFLTSSNAEAAQLPGDVPIHVIALGRAAYDSDYRVRYGARFHPLAATERPDVDLLPLLAVLRAQTLGMPALAMQLGTAAAASPPISFEVEPNTSELCVAVTFTFAERGALPTLELIRPDGRVLRAEADGLALRRGDSHVLAWISPAPAGAWRARVLPGTLPATTEWCLSVAGRAPAAPMEVVVTQAGADVQARVTWPSAPAGVTVTLDAELPTAPPPGFGAPIGGVRPRALRDFEERETFVGLARRPATSPTHVRRTVVLDAASGATFTFPIGHAGVARFRVTASNGAGDQLRWGESRALLSAPSAAPRWFLLVPEATPIGLRVTARRTSAAAPPTTVEAIVDGDRHELAADGDGWTAEIPRLHGPTVDIMLLVDGVPMVRVDGLVVG